AIATPLTPYHDHNAAKARPALLRRLGEGAAIALVSDAGTPLVSDPGYKLVRAAQDAGHLVTALPGASAVLAALSVAGLPTDQFFFGGFLSPKAAARRARIAELARIRSTLILFETGPRIAATLADLAAGLGGEREAAWCRELTKLHEEIKRGDLAALAQACAGELLRGEIVIVIAPPRAEAQVSVADAESLLRDALARLSVKDAVNEVAHVTGRPRREIYRAALSLSKDGNNGAPRSAAQANKAGAAAGARRGVSSRTVRREPRRAPVDRQSLSHPRPALENPVRRNRHCRAPPRRPGLCRGQDARQHRCGAGGRDRTNEA